MIGQIDKWWVCSFCQVTSTAKWAFTVFKSSC